MNMKKYIVLSLIALLAVSCKQERQINMNQLADNYALVTIPAPDLTGITDNGKEVLQLYRKAADEVDAIYWQQYYGDKQALLDSLTDPDEKLYAEINYGPWDRIDGVPFLLNFNPRPIGARFYPEDMTKKEFQAWQNPDKNSPYTLVRRTKEGGLQTVWYHDAYADHINEIAG